MKNFVFRVCWGRVHQLSRLAISAAVARAIAAGGTSRGGGIHARRACVAVVWPQFDLASQPAPTPRQRLVPVVVPTGGRARPERAARDMFDVRQSTTRNEAPAGLLQRSSQQAAGPVPTDPADVLTLTVAVARLRQQLVEHAHACPRDTRSDRAMRRAQPRRRFPAAWSEQCGELESGDLGEGGPVDVVARDQSPCVQLHPRIDGVACFGAE